LTAKHPVERMRQSRSRDSFGRTRNLSRKLYEVKNFQITKDQVLAITAGIIQTEILKEKWDGEKYWLRAQIKADLMLWSNQLTS